MQPWKPIVPAGTKKNESISILPVLGNLLSSAVRLFRNSNEDQATRVDLWWRTWSFRLIKQTHKKKWFSLHLCSIFFSVMWTYYKIVSAVLELVERVCWEHCFFFLFYFWLCFHWWDIDVGEIAFFFFCLKKSVMYHIFFNYFIRQMVVNCDFRVILKKTIKQKNLLWICLQEVYD